MQCQSCEHKNSSQAKFCEECGNKLRLVCSNCSFENNLSAKFCMECGNKFPVIKDNLKSHPLSTKPNSEHQKEDKAERRQLTVLFCDLVGSTALSEKLDAEEYRQIVLEYQQVAEKVISRYGGHIAQYLGDGLLVYFGFPRALEDAPNASIKAALGILEAVECSNEEWVLQGKTKIEIRIGIHTGLVVVDDFLAMGDTVNIAARLEGLAPVNGVVISPQTKKLVEGWFELKSRGKEVLKGIQKPIEIFQVLDESGVRSRIEIVVKSEHSPIIGREIELDILNQSWEEVKKGENRFILLSGEGGIGKSRLVDYAKQIVANETNARHIEFYCNPHFQNEPFYPIIDTLQKAALFFEKNDSSETKFNKLKEFLIKEGLDLIDSIPLMARLLNLSVPKSYCEASTSQEEWKKNILNIFSQIFYSPGTERPSLLVFEDLQWADPSTLDWIEVLLGKIQSSSTFTICTTRPQFQPHWINLPSVQYILLNRLSEKMVETLCIHQTKGKALPKEILRQIQSKTDGIPLFVEELSKMILESGMVEEGSNEFQLTDRMSALSIPSTLKDSLMARLDRMSSEKDTIQTAAVLGREFSFELLHATSKKSENDLKRDLLQLEQAGMIYKKAAHPSLSFAFKHALVQDAAYESLLRSRRQDLHLKVATVLENNFTTSFEQQPSILAHHQSKAGLIARAIQNWKQASKQAKNKFAEKEAIEHLKSALQVIPSLTPGTDQNKTEFDLLLSLSSLLLNKYGFSNPEIKEVNERLVELSFELNKEEEIFISQLALVQNELGNGNLKVMDKLNNLLSVAIDKDDSFLIAASHNVIGMVNLVLGQYHTAMKHFELTLSFYEPELHEKLKSQTGGNLITQTLGNYALVLHATGSLKEAEKKIDTLHTLAKKLNTLIDLSISDGLSCHFRSMQKKYPQVLDHCKSGLARFKEDNQSFFIHAMNVFNYSSQACINNDKEAAYLALESMPKYRSGFNFMNARNYIPIGEAFKAIKSPQEGLKLIDEALEIVYTVGEEYFLSELYRLKGDFLFMLKKSNNEIEAAYCKSLKIAQEQSAKWWELMTAISLSNYWKSEGKIKEAYELLRDAYNWFSNDIDLKDLQVANELLKDMEMLLC